MQRSCSAVVEVQWLQWLQRSCSTVVAVVAAQLQRCCVAQEQQQGLGITLIPMALGSVRDAERRSFQLSTPYGTFRSATKTPLNYH